MRLVKLAKSELGFCDGSAHVYVAATIVIAGFMGQGFKSGAEESLNLRVPLVDMILG